MSSTRRASNNMPKATLMTTKQMGDYLADLRTNRIPRPNGSRPLPQSSVRRPMARDLSNDTFTSINLTSSDVVQSKRSSSRSSNGLSRRTLSGLSTFGHGIERDSHFPPYVGETERQKEREEAREVRLALEELDSCKGQRVHSVAQKEATDVMWNSQNLEASFHSGQGNAVSTLIELPIEDRLAVRLAKVPQGEECLRLDKQRSLSSRVHSSISSLTNRRTSSGSRRVSSGAHRRTLFANPDDRIFEDPLEPVKTLPSQVDEKVAEAQPAYVRRNPFARARSMRQSLPNITRFTSKGMVFEKVETQRTRSVQPEKPKRVSDGASLSNSKEDPTKLESVSHAADEVKIIDGFSVRSDEIRAATSMRSKDRSPKLTAPTIVTNTFGRPIVSFGSDWRRSNKEHNVNDESNMQRPSPVTRRFCDSDVTTSASVPIIPNLNYPNIPSIRIEDEPLRFDNSPQTYTTREIPTITLDGSPVSTNDDVSIASFPVPPFILVNHATADRLGHPTRAQRTPQIEHSGGTYSTLCPVQSPARHSASVPVPSTPRSSPSVRANTILCALCALPISGKIVTAAGTRFHPGCFVCFHCGEGLECVAFYPEPTERHAARISRIRRRVNGEEDSDDEDHASEAEDEDEFLRFYCHLDFHELFSPRCKNCRTPIEGEIIVACGAEWHAGHFFCAQCGNPFDQTTPFVEKDGYAWCINCHTNRFSAKCKKCKHPITDTIVTALGAEWHDECFCCAECHGNFEDGQYFLRGESQDPVCFSCEEKRLKA